MAEMLRKVVAAAHVPTGEEEERERFPKSPGRRKHTAAQLHG